MGLAGSNEAGLTYSGRSIRLDARHAFPIGKAALSVGLGASAVMAQQPTDANGGNSGGVYGAGADVPVLIGVRNSTDLYAFWFGPRGGFEILGGRIQPGDPTTLDDIQARHFYAGLTAGARVGFRHVHLALELNASYHYVNGTFSPAPDPAGNDVERPLDLDKCAAALPHPGRRPGDHVLIGSDHVLAEGAAHACPPTGSDLDSPTCRRLLRASVLLAAAAVGCSAPVMDDVADASGAMTEGVVLVERTVAGDGATQTNVSAKFMRLSTPLDPDLAERVVGSKLDLPAVGSCRPLRVRRRRRQGARAQHPRHHRAHRRRRRLAAGGRHRDAAGGPRLPRRRRSRLGHVLHLAGRRQRPARGRHLHARRHGLRPRRSLLHRGRRAARARRRPRRRRRARRRRRPRRGRAGHRALARAGRPPGAVAPRRSRAGRRERLQRRLDPVCIPRRGARRRQGRAARVDHALGDARGAPGHRDARRPPRARSARSRRPASTRARCASTSRSWGGCVRPATGRPRCSVARWSRRLGPLRPITPGRRSSCEQACDFAGRRARGAARRGSAAGRAPRRAGRRSGAGGGGDRLGRRPLCQPRRGCGPRTISRRAASAGRPARSSRGSAPTPRQARPWPRPARRAPPRARSSSPAAPSTARARWRPRSGCARETRRPASSWAGCSRATAAPRPR